MTEMPERRLILTTFSTDELQQLVRDEMRVVLAEHNAAGSKPEAEEIGGIELAATVTGLARATIYGLVAQSKIPCMKRGKKLYFSRSELIGWLKKGRRKTTEDIESDADNYLRNKKKRGRI